MCLPYVVLRLGGRLKIVFQTALQGLGADLAVAEHDPFLRGQAVQADGAADVDFVGGNADFRAEAVFEAVGKTGGGVYHHAGGIDGAQEGSGTAEVFGYDAVGVAAAVEVDVGDGFFKAADDFDGKHGGEVFGVPVLVGGRLNVGQYGQRLRAAAQFHAFFAVFFNLILLNQFVLFVLT